MTDPRPFSSPSGSPSAPVPGLRRIVVGIGANLGDREAFLARALDRIDQSLGQVTVSPLYETAPVGGPDQGSFLNAACVLRPEARLPEVLRVLQGIESDLGRVRTVRWGPRTIDLDILWAEGETVRSSSLSVPHTELANREFALRPLIDVAPDATDPISGLPYVQILGELEDQQVARIQDENWWKRCLG